MKKFPIKPYTTAEALLSLNNGSMTFEQARAFFDVSLPVLKSRLVTFNIFEWDEGNGPVRIHGGDYSITIVIKGIPKSYVVHGTTLFKDVISMIEGDLRLSPGCYKLTYHREPFGDVQVQTAHDWHFCVENFKDAGYFVHFDLEIFPSGKTADKDSLMKK